MAKQVTLRFLRHFGMCDPAFLDAHLEPVPMPRQKVIEVTATVTIATDDFRFVVPVAGLVGRAEGRERCSRATAPRKSPHPTTTAC